MFTEQDERRGLVKLNWNSVRNRVKAVEPTFTTLVDELDPDESFSIYLAYLPYGALKGDTDSIFLPKFDKGFYKLSDPDVPKDILNDLGYGKNSSPFGMVLEKELEYFVDLKEENITIPWAIYTPGKFFSFGRNLDQKNERTYVPNGVLTVTSGARSAFMLPNIGCATHHINLQRDFNVKTPAPKSVYEHWHVFKEIINSELVECDWRSCLIYFSEKWVEKLHHDAAWLKLKLYLHELAWTYFEYKRCKIYHDIAFSIIQKKRNLKPNPYLSDTARHLFTIALGEAPGYAPACNDKSLPLEVLQKIFVNSYGMKKYFTTIMQPTLFSFEKDIHQVYYSLQNPSTFSFSPKSRKISSTLLEMRELQHIMNVFTNELSKNSTICSDTAISKAAQEVEFNYFHNKPDRHGEIKSSSKIIKIDDRFEINNPDYNSPEAVFASDATFIRGCIGVKRKHDPLT